MDDKSTAAAAVSAKDLQESVNRWFEDTELLVFSLRKTLEAGLKRFPYFSGDYSPEAAEEVRQHIQHQRKSTPETLKEQQRISAALLNHLEITCDDERWKLLELAYANLKTNFSTGRYKDSPFAWLVLRQATHDLLVWSDGIVPFYGFTEEFDKKHTADFRKAQDRCPVSDVDLDNIEARLFTEKAQVLSILEQRLARETQQQLLQTLNRQPAVLPPVPVYVPADTPAQTARLQNLHNVFRDIRSPKQLTDSMAELGCVIYQLCQEGLLPKHDILQELGRQAAEQSRGIPGGGDLVDHCYQTLCVQAASIFSSSRDRMLLRPVATDVTQTDWGRDYADQGHRFALFIQELLGQLKTGKQEQTTAPQEPKQEKATARKVGNRSRTDPETHIAKLRHKISNGYQYKSYEQLRKDIGGSNGTWNNIFKDPKNTDLLEWKDNRGVYARNNQLAVEQLSCEPEVYLPDEEVEKLYKEYVEKLDTQERRDQAWEAFHNMDNDVKRRVVQTLEDS